MNLIGVRIDGRLIHGQVANLWIPKLQIDRVIVVDDKVSKSDIEKSGLRLAAPMGVKLSVLTVEKASQQLKDNRYGNQRLLIITKTPQPLLALVENGVGIKEINVGNMSKTDTTQMITNSINVTDEDVDSFKQLHQNGIKIIAQMVPGTKEDNFMELLKKFNGGVK